MNRLKTLNWNVEISTETKVADEIEIGFVYDSIDIFGDDVQCRVIKIKDGYATAEIGPRLHVVLKQKEDGWYDQHCHFDPEAIVKIQIDD